MLQNQVVIKLLESGATHKGLLLLEYIRDNFMLDVIGADLQRSNPIVYKSSADVKAGYEELVNAGLITGEYVSGNIKSIAVNKDEMTSLLKAGDVVVKIVKKGKTEKVELTPEQEIVLDIIKHYNSHRELPRPSSPTELNKSIIEGKLKAFTPEIIKDAIDYASTQQWVINKGDERWMNLTWIMRNIESFMEGGKYRKESSEPVNKYSTGSDDDIIIM